MIKEGTTHRYASWQQESEQGTDPDNLTEASLDCLYRPLQHVHDLNSKAALWMKKQEEQKGHSLENAEYALVISLRIPILLIENLTSLGGDEEILSLNKPSGQRFC